MMIGNPADRETGYGEARPPLPDLTLNEQE